MPGQCQTLFRIMDQSGKQVYLWERGVGKSGMYGKSLCMEMGETQVASISLCKGLGFVLLIFICICLLFVCLFMCMHVYGVEVSPRVWSD